MMHSQVGKSGSFFSSQAYTDNLTEEKKMLPDPLILFVIVFVFSFARFRSLTFRL